MTCKIIAELGANFGDDMELAKRMIEAAAESGADYVKFQTWSVKNLTPGPWDTDGRRELYEKAELTPEKHFIVKRMCEDSKVRFLTSCFNYNDIDFVSTLTSRIKVPSSEITNWELLRKINQKFDIVFLSTGGSTRDEIKEAIGLLDNVCVILLHCVSAYPCPFENANLNRINWLRMQFNKDVGYSGHVASVFDAISALEYDVKVIEKHFTIDNSLPGRDNKFAILPHELKMLKDYINCRDKMKIANPGDYNACEQELRDIYRGRWQNQLYNQVQE